MSPEGHCHRFQTPDILNSQSFDSACQSPDERESKELIFKAESVSKIYTMGEVQVHALRSVDLELYRGEMIVLLGPSGSGKSTLLNILGGLDTPTSGSVQYCGRELSASNQRELTEFRLAHVGFIFQFYNLIPSLTAFENVALVTEIASQPMTPDEALAMVDMQDRMDHFPAQLSGGEQQRVAVARAIAKQPDVLLCDEPTGALDIGTGITVLEAIAKVNRDIGTTTAVITHNSVIGGMADRVISLADGSIQSIERNTRRLNASELSW